MLLACRIMCVLFWAAVVAVLVAIFAVLLPKALARPIQALINLLLRKLTHGQLIALCLGVVAFLPCTLVIPMQPFIWIAGKGHLSGLSDSWFGYAAWLAAISADVQDGATSLFG